MVVDDSIQRGRRRRECWGGGKGRSVCASRERAVFVGEVTVGASCAECRGRRRELKSDNHPLFSPLSSSPIFVDFLLSSTSPISSALPLSSSPSFLARSVSSSAVSSSFAAVRAVGNRLAGTERRRRRRKRREGFCCGDDGAWEGLLRNVGGWRGETLRSCFFFLARDDDGAPRTNHWTVNDGSPSSLPLEGGGIAATAAALLGSASSPGGCPPPPPPQFLLPPTSAKKGWGEPAKQGRGSVVGLWDGARAIYKLCACARLFPIRVSAVASSDGWWRVCACGWVGDTEKKPASSLRLWGGSGGRGWGGKGLLPSPARRTYAAASALPLPARRLEWVEEEVEEEEEVDDRHQVSHGARAARDNDDDDVDDVWDSWRRSSGRQRRRERCCGVRKRFFSSPRALLVVVFGRRLMMTLLSERKRERGRERRGGWPLGIGGGFSLPRVEMGGRVIHSFD